MTELEMAWLSGIFEGEGCIAWQKKNSVYLSISMTDKDVIEKVAKITNMGNVYHRSFEHKKDAWVWGVARKSDVVYLLEQMFPFLGERRSLRAAESIVRLDAVRDEGFCKQGHPLNSEHLYISPKGTRMCRTCNYANQKARRRENVNDY